MARACNHHFKYRLEPVRLTVEGYSMRPVKGQYTDMCRCNLATMRVNLWDTDDEKVTRRHGSCGREECCCRQHINRCRYEEDVGPGRLPRQKEASADPSNIRQPKMKLQARTEKTKAGANSAEVQTERGHPGQLGDTPCMNCPNYGLQDTGVCPSIETPMMPEICVPQPSKRNPKCAGEDAFLVNKAMLPRPPTPELVYYPEPCSSPEFSKCPPTTKPINPLLIPAPYRNSNPEQQPKKDSNPGTSQPSFPTDPTIKKIFVGHHIPVSVSKRDLGSGRVLYDARAWKVQNTVEQEEPMNAGDEQKEKTSQAKAMDSTAKEATTQFHPETPAPRQPPPIIARTSRPGSSMLNGQQKANTKPP
ncbi:hypothetical protein NDU88_000311 [Pleurodeles waltl]|uniref:Uncharacterized protein n=1 Tax=Pleurodeles waltl TaxID=8319 RepID=A0AAV7KXK6_PLEWA|nr:hypothetical protein NDU88_000311 [Pleurodeles waltl]